MVEITQLKNEMAYNSSASVGATSVKISGAKARKSYVFRNISTGGQVITIALSNFSVAVANNGIVLNVNDAIVDSNTGGYNCWSGDVHAVASAAGGTLAISEVI